jgi:hypothetical protein
MAIGLVACGSEPPPTAQATAVGQTYKNVTAAQLKQMLTAKDFVLVNVHVPYAGELAQTEQAMKPRARRERHHYHRVGVLAENK